MRFIKLELYWTTWLNTTYISPKWWKWFLAQLWEYIPKFKSTKNSIILRNSEKLRNWLSVYYFTRIWWISNLDPKKINKFEFGLSYKNNLQPNSHYFTPRI